MYSEPHLVLLLHFYIVRIKVYILGSYAYSSGKMSLFLCITNTILEGLECNYPSDELWIIRHSTTIHKNMSKKGIRYLYILWVVTSGKQLLNRNLLYGT